MRGTLTATGLALAAIVLAVYALACSVDPYGRCRRCKGKRHRTTLIRKRPRPCRRCKSSGVRLRIGRRLWNRARRTARQAA